MQMTMPLGPLLTSISLGLLSSASPCLLPLYPGFLAYLSSQQSGHGIRWGRYLLGAFVLALSVLAGAAQRWITLQFARHARLINLASGVLLVGVAIYDLASNWDMIQTLLFGA